MMLRRAASVLVAIGCVVLLGCGDGGPSLTPVKGKVIYKDQPVAGATVVFNPVDQGMIAMGQTDASGEYTLNTGGRPGAKLGKYRVSVTKVKQEGDTSNLKPEDMLKMKKENAAPKSTNELPAKYAAAPTSGLEAEVTADKAKNSFEFKLSD